MELKKRALSPKSQQHLQLLAALAARSQEQGWTFGTFQRVLDKPRIYGVGVFDVHNCLHAYVIYDTATPRCLNILALVVDPKVRLKGIATNLLAYLQKETLGIFDANRIRVVLNEENIDGQKFLRAFSKKTSMTLRTSVIRDEPRDGFVFVFHEQEEEACV